MTLLEIIQLAGPTILAGVVLFFIKNLSSTKKEIFDRLDKAVSEEKVVQLIEYRFGPIKEDIRDIKHDLDRLLDYQLRANINDRFTGPNS